MKKGTISVRAWDAREREIQQAEIRAETDEVGNVFFKIEGKNDGQLFMIDYSYSKQKLVERYFEIINMLLEKQSQILTL